MAGLRRALHNPRRLCGQALQAKKLKRLEPAGTLVDMAPAVRRTKLDDCQMLSIHDQPTTPDRHGG